MSRLGFALLFLATTHAYSQRHAYIFFQDSRTVQFAAEKIRTALTKEGFVVSINPEKSNGAELSIILSIFNQNAWIKTLSNVAPRYVDLDPEGFSIQRLQSQEKTTVFVTAIDIAGMMYGGFELAEVIRTQDLEAVTDVIQNPYMKRRGVKMNIPLDVRTPSYTDMSDAAQQNIAEMWSMDFWKEYLDSLASYRFNFVSLWSLHPFPSMVKVPEYPEVALQDVHRSKAAFKEYYSTRATGYDAPEIVNNYDVVKKISIEEKIKFWQDVMQYAKDRNISFYIVTWNIYTYGTGGKYGITDDIKNTVTRDYFRRSVKELFLTYPLLAGIGLTTGENMPGADFQTKEDWAFETYAQGVIDVTKIQPNRKITLIHRQHEAGAQDIVKKFSSLIENKNVNFVFSFKYAQAHVYSSTRQIHHHEFVRQVTETKKFRTLWTLRNDDVYYFRWGSPDFVREFMKNIPMDVTEGYYYGSDQYVWGREFLNKYPGQKRQIEIAKHWYQWMLWGRLGYNPDMSNDRLIAKLESRYPQVNGRQLFDTWQSASMIYPLTTGFHYGALDFQWYIEASKSRPEPAQTASGFHDINRFITLPPYKATNTLSIPEYVKIRDKGAIEATTPFEVAEKIHQSADDALRGTTNILTVNDELYKTIEDIKTMSYLGKYYAHKISAATHLAIFNADSTIGNRDAAISELNHSAYYWRCFASNAMGQYKNPLWTNRVGYVDWKQLYKYVLKDIVDLQGDIRLKNMDTRDGGTILEAEAASLHDIQEHVDVKGYTGNGYVSSRESGNEITIEFNAEASGKYILEFRYIADDVTTRTRISIDNVSNRELIFWPSGTSENWVWDKLETNLSKGTHKFSFSLPDGIMLDHVNVYPMIP